MYESVAEGDKTRLWKIEGGVTAHPDKTEETFDAALGRTRSRKTHDLLSQRLATNGSNFSALDMYSILLYESTNGWSRLEKQSIHRWMVVYIGFSISCICFWPTGDPGIVLVRPCNEKSIW